MLTNIQSQKAAKQFAEEWQGKGYEKGDTQKFWLELLQNVLGVQDVFKFIEFEDQVLVENTNFMDGYIPATKVLIEQKSIEKELGKPVVQSDGSLLNPFQQAKKYIVGLPLSRHPRWVVTCNFREFWVYDMEQPNGEPQKILLQNLEKEYYRLQFLVDEGNEHLKREMEVSVKAGELVGIIYDKLLEQYQPLLTADAASRERNTESRERKAEIEAEVLRSLNILCVRLVFCLYAEDAGLFASKTAFHDYLAPFSAPKIRKALIDLFEVLDTPLKQRDVFLEADLAAFPYVNGGLFGHRSADGSSAKTTAGEPPASRAIIIPQFTEELKQLLLEKASADFDWSEISPTIFGAVFESTLNPETRRSGGMHYTSIENIHKVIDPLFMNDLRAEFEGIMRTRTSALQVRQRLQSFQDKLASLTFLDPACGSGNFLTETFLSLRRLENEVIKAMYGDARQFDFGGTIKVNISQFYGIEINDFACTVAKTALWIAESQTLQETSHIVGVDLNFLPLKTNAYIHEGNALRMDWGELFVVANASERSEDTTLGSVVHFPDYIIGNPPFVGKKEQSKIQKEEVFDIFGKKWKGIGNIDYVACWYKKAIELMQRSEKTIHAAFVSTNSITQGEQVATLWQPLQEQYGLQIDFAYRTFRWDSEADIKAHVHCVIIGFSLRDTIGIPKGCTWDADGSFAKTTAGEPPASQTTKRIYLSDNQVITAKNINAYLLDAPNVFIGNRTKPLCDVPQMMYGSMPIDDGHLILDENDVAELLRENPQNERFIRPYAGGAELIKNTKRWCLWLQGISPKEMLQSKFVMNRIEQTKQFRLSSDRPQTLKAADTPYLFGEIRQPESDMLVIPKVSSETRRYIPISFVGRQTIVNGSALIIPEATLYAFGVLMSNVHNAWMRVVAGRMKSDYQYSANIVYNNFPWPLSERTRLACNNEQAMRNDMQASRLRSSIEQTAQAILDARHKYADCSLAELYNELTMPPELRKAHQDNDRAVMQAYGLIPGKTTESECVAELFKMYQEMTK